MINHAYTCYYMKYIKLLRSLITACNMGRTLHINKIYAVKTRNNLLFPENMLFMDTARSENKLYDDI